MASQAELKPVEDNVPKVDGAVAVGEDLEFQRRWWRFERVVWSFFALVLLADLSGLLGRGPLADAERQTADGTLKYERVLRENTPSTMTFLPNAAALRNGELQLYVSNSVLKQFGAQRVIPQPKTTTLGGDGVTYTFPVTQLPVRVEIELKPSFIGRHAFSVSVPGGEAIQAKSLVLP